jgi:glutamate/tyrosine decarboxylase-like PLP-dependent enzyme
VTFESILGDMYSSSVTNPGFNWSCSPACTELEQVVMEWMVTILGLDDVFRTSSGKGGGIIGVSGRGWVAAGWRRADADSVASAFAHLGPPALPFLLWPR